MFNKHELCQEENKRELTTISKGLKQYEGFGWKICQIIGITGWILIKSNNGRGLAGTSQSGE